MYYVRTKFKKTNTKFDDHYGKTQVNKLWVGGIIALAEQSSLNLVSVALDIIK